MVTERNALSILLIFIVMFTVSLSATAATVIINNSTPGFYNNGLGFALNGTNPVVDDNGVSTFLFPNNNSNPNDPTIDLVTTEPDLSTALSILGNWLINPSNPGGTWSTSMQAIPSTWNVDTETAIIYQIDVGSAGFPKLIGEFGVDNGLFVWLDGIFQGGHLSPGGAVLGELTLDLGSLNPGRHYLQVLREDHGVATGYSTRVSVVPLPGAVWLFGTGLLGLVGFRRKFKNN